MPYRSRPGRAELGSAAILLGLLLALVCGPVSLAGWQVVDDHDIIRNARPQAIHPQLEAPWHSLAALVEFTAANGRFFPVTNALRFWVARAIGPNATDLHLLVLSMGWLTLLALFAAGRNLGLGFPAALLWPVLTFLAPDAFSNWYRLGTGESWGSLFLALSLLAATRSGHGSAGAGSGLITAAVLASLCKESFIAVLPGLALLLVLVRRRALGPIDLEAGAAPGKGPPQTVLSLLALFVVLAGVIATIILHAPVATEGRLALHPPGGASLSLVLQTLLATIIVGGGWVPVLMCRFLPSAANGGSRLRQLAGALGLLAAAWVVPQEVLYLGRGGALERFALPAAVGASLCLVLALERLWREGGRLLRGLLGAWLVGWLALALLHTAKAASACRADALALNQMVGDLVRALPRDAVVVVDVPPTRIEALWSVATLLANAGRNDLVFRYSRNEEAHGKRMASRAWIEAAASVLDREAAERFGRPTHEDLRQAGATVLLGESESAPLGMGNSWSLRRWCATRLSGNLLRGVLVTRESTCYAARVMDVESSTQVALPGR